MGRSGRASVAEYIVKKVVGEVAVCESIGVGGARRVSGLLDGGGRL